MSSSSCHVGLPALSTHQYAGVEQLVDDGLGSNGLFQRGPVATLRSLYAT
jgi:hypothetical protein